MIRIIDVHSHYMPAEVAKNTSFFKVHWSDIDQQLRSMDKLGIEKSVLLYPTSDAHLQMGGWANLCKVYNEGIANIIRKYPDRFIGAGILPIDNQDAVLAELKRLRDLGLKLISIASSYDGKYLDDEKFMPVFDFAKVNNMPIHVHSQIINPIGEERVRDPLLSPVLEYVFDVSMCIGKMMMGGILKKYNTIIFIFAHYGGVIPFLHERFDNTYQMLRSRNFVKDLGQLPKEYFRNLYFDTSGSKSLGSLLCTLEVVDASHILFGSDFPANQNIKDSISVIQNSSLKDDEKSNIFINNVYSIFCN